VQILTETDCMAQARRKDSRAGFSVQRALAVLQSCRVYGRRSGELSMVTCDSRRVGQDACFVAISGEKTDGHDYVPAAAAAGARLFVVEHAVAVPRDATMVITGDARKAAALLAAEFYGNPSTRLDVVGITGTHGKTTTTYMLRHIAASAGLRAGMLTTVRYDSGRRSMKAPQTTPDSILLNELLAEAAGSGVRVMPMEVSSHSLCQHRVTGIDFRGALFTNLASDHLDYHQTREAYREAKGRLFEMLRPDAFCVLNADDVNWTYYADRTSARVMTYSARQVGDVQGCIRSADVRGVEFDLLYRGERHPVRQKLLGIHNVENALGAAACALSLGLEAAEVAAALESFPGVPGRLESMGNGQGFSVFVDFAHTDGSLATVLSNLKPYVRGRLILVFGAGGDRDRTKRPRMAEAAARFADFSILTSDNPRSENPQEIIAQIRTGFRNGAAYTIEPDRRKSIFAAVNMARPGDVVLIAGKGHEDYQIFADRVEHFDDREVVREALEKDS
jgi:UDP-N-acetylmuramoyl-L-alanyl-D-glutamate--2,6-diaminopimelate ligase